MSESIPIAVIAGDGIGPEVVEAELQVLEAVAPHLSYTHYAAGDDELARSGQAMPAETLEGALAARGVIFGAAGTSAAAVILRLRAELGTFANLRPAKGYPGVPCLHPETDMLIVRENTECLYAGHEAEVADGIVTGLRVISREASLRIARFAFEQAKQQGYTKVTAAHKNNVLIKGDGLFMECCRQAAGENPDIEFEEALIDSLAMRMVMDPKPFQVIVTTNLFGDIISDLAAGLIGGLGLCPSANLGLEHALFEPVHGSAPDIAGQGVANPSSAILCGAMLLDHLGLTAEAARVRAALEECLAQARTTPDLGGKLSTSEMARAVIAAMD